MVVLRGPGASAHLLDLKGRLGEAFWIFVLQESEEDEMQLGFGNECRLGNSSPSLSPPWGV
jgi:hypothetical protein